MILDGYSVSCYRHSCCLSPACVYLPPIVIPHWLCFFLTTPLPPFLPPSGSLVFPIFTFMPLFLHLRLFSSLSHPPSPFLFLFRVFLICIAFIIPERLPFCSSVLFRASSPPFIFPPFSYPSSSYSFSSFYSDNSSKILNGSVASFNPTNPPGNRETYMYEHRVTCEQ